MNRREFIRRAGGSALALALAPAAVLSSTGKDSFAIDGLTVGTTGLSDIVVSTRSDGDVYVIYDGLRYEALAQYRADVDRAMLFGERGIVATNVDGTPQTVTIKGFTWTES